eukprot:2060269-Prymnesium_polylepis.1
MSSTSMLAGAASAAPPPAPLPAPSSVRRPAGPPTASRESDKSVEDETPCGSSSSVVSPLLSGCCSCGAPPSGSASPAALLPAALLPPCRHGRAAALGAVTAGRRRAQLHCAQGARNGPKKLIVAAAVEVQVVIMSETLSGELNVVARDYLERGTLHLVVNSGNLVLVVDLLLLRRCQ